MLMLHYVEIGDRYLLSLKDMVSKTFICKRQTVPREFAIYRVPVDELDDPADVLRNLKERLVEKICNEAHLIRQVGADEIDKSFFIINRPKERVNPFR